MGKVSVEVKDVSMKFNLNSEKLDSVKEEFPSMLDWPDKTNTAGPASFSGSWLPPLLLLHAVNDIDKRAPLTNKTLQKDFILLNSLMGKIYE